MKRNLLAPCAVLACAVLAAPRARAAGVTWDFEDSLLGWSLAHDLESCGFEDGALCLTVTGGDPYLVGPRIDIAAGEVPYWIASLRIESGHGGEVFFSSSASPGIIAGNSVTFTAAADGEFHVSSVYMPSNSRWSGTIDRVRLDPPAAAGSRIWIDWIKLAGRKDRPAWFFDDPAEGDLWKPNPNLSAAGVSEGSYRLQVVSGGAGDPWLTGPPVELAAEKDAVLSAGLAVSGSGAETASVYFITAEDPQWNEAKVLSVPIARGAQSVHQFHLGSLPTWRGRITALRFDPIAANPLGADVAIDFLAFDLLWDFAGHDPDGWKAEGQIEGIEHNGGDFSFTVTGQNARFFREDALDASAYGALQLRLRCDGGGSWGWRAFFTSDAAPDPTHENLSFTLPCDGVSRLLTIDLTANSLWRDGVTSLGIEPAAAPPGGASRRLVCESVRLRPRWKGLSITRLEAASGAVISGEPFSVQAEVTNLSTLAVTGATATLSATGARVRSGANPAAVAALAPGESARLAWELDATAAERATISVEVQAPGARGDTASASVTVLPPDPGPGPSAPGASVVERPNGSLSLQNEERAIVFLKDPTGFQCGVLYVLEDAAWRRLGLLRPLFSAEIAAARGRESLSLITPQARIAAAGPSRGEVVFTATDVDADGTTWRAEASFEALPAESEIRARWKLAPNRASALASFTGPLLGVGEGSFGTAKEEALLPGLEWLAGEEVSSSTLDIRTSEHVRRVPHPYKITVPAVSVATAEGVAGLLWDLEEAWIAGQRHTSLIFDCPDRIFNLNRNLLGLFVPSVSEFVRENETNASTPVPLAANQEATIRCRIFLAPRGTVLDPVKRWYDIYGAEVPYEPRSFGDQLELSLRGLTDVLWDPAGPGWAHAAGWTIAPYPSYAAFLLYGGSLLENDPALRATCFDQAETGIAAAIEKWGAGSLITQNGAHMMCGQLPFMAGHLDEGLAQLDREAAGYRAKQQPDGSWPFTGDPELGVPGQVELGTCAHRAASLLFHARITGNASSRDAGLKALARMRAFSIPRAAQTWEVPVHTPDILAAAWAVEAFLEGYLATDREDLLDGARSFAASGLPFVYTWGGAERPVMPGGSIPVFGATWYTGSWFAKPVQWNGFVYARALYRLARRDASFLWRDVALALTRSGFHQQYAAGDHRGLYPDSWDLIRDHPNPVDINPEGLLRTLWFSYDRELEVTTWRVPSWRGTYLVDAVAAIEPIADPEDCAFRLRWFPGQQVLLHIRGPRADAIRVDGATLAKRADVDDVPEAGWSQRTGTSWIVKCVPSGAEAVVALSIGTPPSPPFRRGDANGDRSFDLADAITILSYLFNRSPLRCRRAADANDDGELDIADAISLLSYLFARAADPPAPFPECGPDTTADALDCAGESGC